MADKESRFEKITLPIQLMIDDKSISGMEVFDKISKVYEKEKDELKRLTILAKEGDEFAKKKLEDQQALVAQLNKQYNIEKSIAALEKSETEEGAKFGKFGKGLSQFGAGFTSDGIGSKAMQDIEMFKSTPIPSLAGKGLSIVLDKALDKLKETLESSWQELKKTINESYLTSSTTRENVLGYGLSIGQSYGLEKALSATGIGSVENLLWASPEQAQLFSDTFQRYTDRYNSLYDKGFFDKQLEYNAKIQEFQDDVQLKFMEFFIDNQDTIEKVMNAVLNIADSVLGILDSLIGRETTAADIVNNSSSKNVSVDLSYNISGSVAKNDLLDAGQQTQAALLSVINNYGG